MKILAIDTSTEYCSVALLENEVLISEVNDNASFSHNKKLFTAIDSILKENSLTLKDIDLIACGSGPGSFTGLRVGISAVKSIAYSSSIRVSAINSLDSMAMGGLLENKDSKVRVFFDGKQKDLFTSEYTLKNNLPVRNAEIELISLKEEREIPFSEINIGNVAEDKLENKSYKSGSFPKAHYTGLIAYYDKSREVDVMKLEPEYYKDFKINKSKKQPLM